MNKLLKVFLFCFTMFSFMACNNSGLKERVSVTDGVSVLLPKEYKKNDFEDGNMMIRSKVGTTDLRVVAVVDTSLNNLGPDRLKEGLEENVRGFLLPMQGKLLHRKDTIVGKVVMSDFDFELGNSGKTKQGKGKFILKGNKFIVFLLVHSSEEAKSNESLQKAFFNSIEIE